MSTFRIIGRCIADPPPADWREQLTARLNVKPRRIGTWAELGLYGALGCLADAGETKLPVQACLILSSQHGPVTPLRNAFEQAQEDLPMPLTFLQTQPSQLLATLAARLSWRGDARFITHADPRALLQLAAAQNNLHGMLVGWVEESGAGRSVWLRLIPSVAPAGLFGEIDSLEEHVAQASYLRMTPTGVAALHDQV
ncbi:MAG: hypothetical protein ABIQ90_14630 [Polaromonas sp.]